MASLAEDRGRVLAAIVLNWIAGYVDVVGWNRVPRTVHREHDREPGRDRASRNPGRRDACAALWTRGRNRTWSPLAVEAVLLAAIGFVPGTLPLWGAAVLAFAMGLQNA